MFLEKEQEEIINNFLKVIEMNDLKVNIIITTKVGECVKCKFNKSNLDMYNMFPPEIAKHICKLNFEECKKCFLLRNAKQSLNFPDLHTVMRGHIYDKYRIKIDEHCLTNDNENLRIFLFVQLNAFPTYKKK